MKKYLQSIKRIISVLMIFILLIQQYGCVTSNVISSDNLPSYYPKYTYAVHCNKSVYILEKITVTNDTLTGKIFNPEWEVLQTGNFIHIYPSSDSLVKITMAKFLSIPLAGINKVKSIEEAPKKTITLLVGGIVITLLVLAGLSLSSMSINL